MVALCMPSRTSLLTSRRPDTSRSWTIETDQVRESLGAELALQKLAQLQPFMAVLCIPAGMHA